MNRVDELGTSLSTALAADNQIYTLPGEAFPLGSSVRKGGVNFSVYSKDATRVTLHLFASADATGPFPLL